MGLFGSKTKQQKTSNEPVTLADGQTYEIAAELDCLGSSCPRPQLMTKKALNNASAGDVVKVLVDNPTSMEALPPMCPALAATHLETLSDEQGWQVYIRKN